MLAFKSLLLSLDPHSLVPVSQLPGTHVGQQHCSPGPGLPEDAEDQPHAVHSCPVSRSDINTPFFLLHT